MTLQFTRAFFRLSRQAGTSFARFFEGRALVSKDSHRSPIHLKIELDNGTDFKEKLDNVEVYREF